MTAVLLFPALSAAADVLPSWNNGAARARIVEFIAQTTAEGTDTYVPEEERIAVFDNDGTLWSEQPYYFQLAFALDRVRALAPQHPEWREVKPFKSVLANDIEELAESGERALADLIGATHAGMTTEAFEAIVTDWFANARHPLTGRPFTEMTFLPMRELLDYLRENGFRTYVVSGGGVEFMRPITEAAYGIAPEQVIGSTIAVEYVEGDVPVLRRLPEISFVDDGPGKPVGIHRAIGRRPIFVAGNSDGDYEMLRWVTSGRRAGLAMVVHHTDGRREYAYDRASAFGRLDKVLDEAADRGWLIVDMEDDWKRVYATIK
jgi:phosphoglycolate phosphatase-like HAD superfamily hydrolase